MKKIMRFVIMIGFLGLAMATANTQTTNVVLSAFFVLKGTAQTATGVKSVRVVNKDIIAALNETGVYQFGRKATLLLVSTDNETPVLMVRDVTGGQATTNEVDDYFDITEIGDEVRSPDGSTRWQTWNFAFDNATGDATTNETAFQLWGATTLQSGRSQTRRTREAAISPSVLSDVRGVGRVQGAITIFSGTVSSGNSAPVVIVQP
jgi:hypothetical protein